MAGDWIKLHRKVLKSAISHDSGLLETWIALLLHVNWRPGKFKDYKLMPGQMAFSWRSLPHRLHGHLSRPPAINTLRNRVRKLAQLGLITIKVVDTTTDTRFSVVTVCKWSTYQNDDDAGGTRIDTTHDTTPDTHTDTDRRSKEGKKERRGRRAPSHFVAPSAEEVQSYCRERGNSVDPVKFHAHYTANGWVQGRSGKPIVDWKAAVITWERSDGRFDKPETPQVFDGGFAITNEKFLIAREKELAKQRKESGK